MKPPPGARVIGAGGARGCPLAYTDPVAQPREVSMSQPGPRKSQQAAVRLAMEQFAAVSTIFDAAEMVIYVADMDTYELLFMNAHAERQWGTSRIGQPCYTVLQSGRSAPCEFCTNHRLTEQGRPAQPVVWEFQNTVTTAGICASTRPSPGPTGAWCAWRWRSTSPSASAASSSASSTSG